jgi:8-oxo-dGTP pyrophosphatase MutT (NUDIX family)
VIQRSRDGAEDEILLSVRSDLWGWELPGGTPQPGEGPEATLVREVEEETGLQISVERPVGDYVRTGFRPHTARVFVCRVVEGDLRTSQETPALSWFPTSELPDTLFPWYREPIRDAAIHHDTPVQRQEHQGWASILAGLRIDLRMRMRG